MSNYLSDPKADSMPERPLRVLLVDDSGLSRQALAGMLSRLSGVLVVGQAQGGQEGLALAARLQPDLVITDLHMPGLDGLEVVKQLRASHPGIKSLLVSSHDGPTLEAISLRHGADGFMPKQRLPGELPEFLASLFPQNAALKTAAAASRRRRLDMTDVARTDTPPSPFGGSPRPGLGSLQSSAHERKA